MGNIATGARFVSRPNNNDHIRANSPCRNTGNNTSVTELFDFEGDPRISDGTVDMGADEFYYHLYSMGDVIPGGSIEMKVIGSPSAPVTRTSPGAASRWTPGCRMPTRRC